MTRHEWTRLCGGCGGGCGGVWQHTSGWQVRHCGHPKASWPYYAVSPAGEFLLAPNCCGFRLLRQAQEAVETRAKESNP